MQAVLGEVYNLKLDLERIKFLSQENDDRQASLSDQDDRKKELLEKQKEEMREYLRQWTERVEQNVRYSDLPPEIVDSVLELTTTAKRLGSMNAIHVIAQKVDAILSNVQIYENEKAIKQLTEQMDKMAPTVGLAAGIVAGGVALAPFIQVRYTEEAYRELSSSYVEKKLLPRLAAGTFHTVEAPRVYSMHKSARPTRVLEAEEKIKALRVEAAVKAYLDYRRETGLPPISEEEALATIEKMAPYAQKKLADQAVSKDELMQERIAMEIAKREKAYKDRLELNLRKQLRRHYKDLSDEEIALKTNTLLQQAWQRQQALQTTSAKKSNLELLRAAQDGRSLPKTIKKDLLIKGYQYARQEMGLPTLSQKEARIEFNKMTPFSQRQFADWVIEKNVLLQEEIAKEKQAKEAAYQKRLDLNLQKQLRKRRPDLTNAEAKEKVATMRKEHLERTADQLLATGKVKIRRKTPKTKTKGTKSLSKGINDRLEKVINTPTQTAPDQALANAFDRIRTETTEVLKDKQADGINHRLAGLPNSSKTQLTSEQLEEIGRDLKKKNQEEVLKHLKDNYREVG